jgi:hypothetical protein
MVMGWSFHFLRDFLFFAVPEQTDGYNLLSEGEPSLRSLVEPLEAPVEGTSAEVPSRAPTAPDAYVFSEAVSKAASC